MSRTAVPASFDPFATHPFTNTSGVLPQPPHPQPYGIPINSSSLHAHPHSSATMKPSSLPTSQTPKPLSVHAPHPQRAGGSPPSNMRQPVFEPFKMDRSSPDLKDILAKKGSPMKTTKGFMTAVRT